MTETREARHDPESGRAFDGLALMGLRLTSPISQGQNKVKLSDYYRVIYKESLGGMS